MKKFRDTIDIIGVNPFVLPPEEVLQYLFAAAGKSTGPIPVRGTLNGHPFTQTLVKFSGKWRLYLNGPMRTAAGIDVGDEASVRIEFDPVKRGFAMRKELKEALKNDPEAKKAFDALSPSRRLEIVRYIARLKSEEAVARNVERAIRFLKGKERFVGRNT